MRSLVVLSGGYDGQIKFRVLRRDEILRLERARDRNGGGQACETDDGWRHMVENKADL